ncbi:unnamed protein product [Gongylonema pulchrum]|uniref:Uncharacterized protein n=1 Tax=Gongylonema pulchrum TaxID=637853 RepID=A0A183ES14_9BILA|nr:unnamed protein product [Gongylonema pulchrum]
MANCKPKYESDAINMITNIISEKYSIDTAPERSLVDLRSNMRSGSRSTDWDGMRLIDRSINKGPLKKLVRRK